MRTAAALICAVAAAASHAQEWPSPRRGYETTALEGDRHEHRFYRFSDGILIEDVMINGHGPFRFLLDTGAEGGGRIDHTVAADLGLPRVGEVSNVRITGETRETSVHRIESIDLGGLTFSNVELIGGDYLQLAGPGYPPVHGILGYHLFNEYLLTIDYPARTISVERGDLPPAEGAHVLDIVSDDEDPEIEVAVGGVRLRAMLDTGAMNHFAVPDATGLRFVAEPVVRGRQGDADVLVGDLADPLRIGSIEIEGPQTYITSALNQSIVGARILSQLRVTYDQKNGRVRVERPAPRPGYGMTFGWRGQGPWRFSGVDEGGIAAKAGLRPTDSIVAVNGIAFDEIDREQLLRALDEPAITVTVEREGEPVDIRMSWE